MDDSSPDQPKLRWRYRNYYGDSVAHSQSHESDSCGDSTDSENTHMQNIDEPKRVFVSIFSKPFSYNAGLNTSDGIC